MGGNTIPLVELLTFPVAIVLGFLAGLGVGGGSLLMLWLTNVVQMDYTAAKTINLLFFLPSASIATLYHQKQGAVNFKKLTPVIICGCVAAASFALISIKVDTTLIKKIFGGLLIFTGLHELFYRPRNIR